MSVEWSEGYVTDVNYTFGYYGELNPSRSVLPLIANGYQPPTFRAGCELGFGQGLSLALHAALQPNIDWCGTDFNPAHASFAQSLVDTAEGKARLYDEAFAEFCERRDLPDFDFIGLHGVWTWISNENRKVLVDFIRRKLKPGGVLYISYNTNPGWAASAPLRHLLKRHADIMGVPGEGAAARIDGAIDFVERLLDAKPGYLQANPSVAERFKRLKTQDRSYIAHEYMNRDWQPMSFGEVEEWLSDAKLSFVCSAHTLDHTTGINLTPDQSALIQTVSDASLRETVRDYCTNQQFRRDYWIKGPRKLSASAQVEAFRALRVVLVTPRADWPTTAPGVLGPADLNPTVYGPILEFLADHEPHAIAEVVDGLAEGLNLAQVSQALSILQGLGVVQPAAEPEVCKQSAAASRALNKTLAARALSETAASHLTSPITGAAINATRVQQLFWLAHKAGEEGSEALAKSAWLALRSINQVLVKDGIALQTEDENLDQLRDQARAWTENLLPVWTKLAVV
ncbi:class I SAM-dependent methyltransferase [uncultured Caulobacter sp.]|uniref:class I SAM-dependent methyltransferase n=1 Tax=uncultured Caulobacter sp. TaxID=158749 RepID=UPI00262E0FB9|nr:class I SAM-dependent methyltransferase [uncultured Caulobacter sp.]